MMKNQMPFPTFLKTREQIATEYGMSARTLRRRLIKLRIKIPDGRVMPKDQIKVYRVLGRPLFIWIDDHNLIPYTGPDI